MLRLLADENFSGEVVRGLLLRQPDLDVVRVQDVGFARAHDPDILFGHPKRGNSSARCCAVDSPLTRRFDRAFELKYSWFPPPEVSWRGA